MRSYPGVNLQYALCLYLLLTIHFNLGTLLPQDKEVLNKRLLRSQRVIENAFGIMTTLGEFCCLLCICIQHSNQQFYCIIS